MKKFFGTMILAAMFLLPNTSHAAQREIILPTVNVNADEISVTTALAQRKTTRNFVDGDLTAAQLSKILWAANGITRPDGKRVNPAAMGVCSVEVYAVTREGIFLYDAPANKLTLIAEGDHRMTTTTGQSFVGNAAVNLVFVETPDAWLTARHVPSREAQLSCANVTVGAMVQSVALVAQTEGLGNCVRGSINRDAFAKAAKLSPDKNILLAQSVGFVK